MPGAAGVEELAPARHHRVHRRQLVLRLAAGIAAPGGEDEIGIQLWQALALTSIRPPSGMLSISGGNVNPARRAARVQASGSCAWR